MSTLKNHGVAPVKQTGERGQAAVAVEGTAGPGVLPPQTAVIRVVHPDLFGRQRGKQFPAAHLDSLLRNGIAYSKMSLAEDLLGVPVSATSFPALASHPDLHAEIDSSTIRAVPWEPDSSWILASLFEDGRRSRLCARGQLEHAVELMDERCGLTAVVAGEPEFYLFEEGEDTTRAVPYSRDGVSYTFDRVADPSGAVGRIHRALADFGIGVTAVNREFSPGQFEINLHHTTALEAADRAFLLKTAIKELAIADGLRANFMAKPLTGEEGSSLHMHLSLWSENESRNAFATGSGELSDIARGAIGGIQAHAAALMAFAAPTVNSYKRLSGEGLSPRTSNWGEDDRFTFVRIPPERAEATRIELRAGDASASPHLLLAALMHAARDGIERELRPAAGSPLPRTLEHAIAALEEDGLMRGAFGDEFVSVYAALKRAETAAAGATVSDWEWGLYSRTV